MAKKTIDVEIAILKSDISHIKANTNEIKDSLTGDNGLIKDYQDFKNDMFTFKSAVYTGVKVFCGLITLVGTVIVIFKAIK